MIRARARIVTTVGLGPLLALALALGGSGCDKDNGINAPGDGGNAASDTGAADSDGGGAEYTYADGGFNLLADTKIKFEIRSPEGQGAAKIAAKSLIEAAPMGGGLKVHGTVQELVTYEGSGQMDPEFMKKQAEENGGEAIDIVGELGKAESWFVMDLKGEKDDDASAALAENADAEDDLDFGLFGVPDLPAIDLKPGEKVELPTKEDTRLSPLGEIPVEVDETWVLRGVEGTVAELDLSIEAGGATTVSGGGGEALVSLNEESAFTIFFDLDKRVPVSISGYSASEMSIDAGGQTFDLATNSEIEATYAVQ